MTSDQIKDLILPDHCLDCSCELSRLFTGRNRVNGKFICDQCMALRAKMQSVSDKTA